MAIADKCPVHKTLHGQAIIRTELAQQEARLTPQDVLSLSAMPPANPSYPRGPYRFLNREYLIITYETDPEAIRALVPEPAGARRLRPYALRMDRHAGQFRISPYHRSGLVIPCTFRGDQVNYTAMMFLNDEPPISAGREIAGLSQALGLSPA